MMGLRKLCSGQTSNLIIRQVQMFILVGIEGNSVSDGKGE